MLFIDVDVPVRFRAQQQAKHSSLQLTANCIAAIRCPYTTLNWFENHQPQRTQISTIHNAPYIKNSNQMAFSVNLNRKFSECILSTPAIFKATSKLFCSQGCFDDKNWLDFSSIFFKIWRFRSSILLSL